MRKIKNAWVSRIKKTLVHLTPAVSSQTGVTLRTRKPKKSTSPPSPLTAVVAAVAASPLRARNLRWLLKLKRKHLLCPRKARLRRSFRASQGRAKLTTPTKHTTLPSSLWTSSLTWCVILAAAVSTPSSPANLEPKTKSWQRLLRILSRHRHNRSKTVRSDWATNRATTNLKTVWRPSDRANMAKSWQKKPQQMQLLDYAQLLIICNACLRLWAIVSSTRMPRLPWTRSTRASPLARLCIRQLRAHPLSRVSRCASIPSQTIPVVLMTTKLTCDFWPKKVPSIHHRTSRLWPRPQGTTPKH